MPIWLRRPTPEYIQINPPQQRERIGKGVWHKCVDCGMIVRAKDWALNFKVCPGCGRHDRLSAEERLTLLVDPGTWQETDSNLVSVDALKFVDSKKYTDRVAQARKQTGQNDAVMIGRAEMGAVPVSLAVMNFFFMGGSMGVVVGEKVTRAMEMAVAENRACIVVSSTGGARMQEGVLSLMQLAKTAALCKKMQDKGIPFISILTDPSTAGIMASFASLGDIIIAEPRAYVGFAGRRVIEQTIRQSLPANFQTAEFVRDHGFVDSVVARGDMRRFLITFMRQIRGLKAWTPEDFERTAPAAPTTQLDE